MSLLWNWGQRLKTWPPRSSLSLRLSVSDSPGEGLKRQHIADVVFKEEIWFWQGDPERKIGGGPLKCHLWSKWKALEKMRDPLEIVCPIMNQKKVLKFSSLSTKAKQRTDRHDDRPEKGTLRKDGLQGPALDLPQTKRTILMSAPKKDAQHAEFCSNMMTNWCRCAKDMMSHSCIDVHAHIYCSQACVPLPNKIGGGLQGRVSFRVPSSVAMSVALLEKRHDCHRINCSQ